MSDHLSQSPLGKTSLYEEHYNPDLLFPILRDPSRAKLLLRDLSDSGSSSSSSPTLLRDPSDALRDLSDSSRAKLGVTGEVLPFHGVDLWTAFELSWLTPSGKPEVATAEIEVPCTSPCIVESKSLKLYFNSFNQTVFTSQKEVQDTLEKDLSKAAGAPVVIRLYVSTEFHAHSLRTPQGFCLDSLDIKTSTYDIDKNLLQLSDEKKHVSETVYTNLFKSNCPCTGQPDWATVEISYVGPYVTRESLLSYLVSYRKHQGFHEQCTENIFLDLLKKSSPQSLTVHMRFTRRGGIDINPLRTTEKTFSLDPRRLSRQ